MSIKIIDITSKIGSGLTPFSGSKVYKDSGIAFIRSQNILDFHFSTEGLVFIDDKQAKKLKNVIVQEGDILLNITGDSVARCCIVPEEILPARVNQHIAIIRSKGVSNYYLLYYFQYLKPHLLKICKIGGTRNALTKEMIEQLPFLANTDQYKIASILSNLDKKITLNNSMISELEKIAKTIYDYWFLQFDFPNNEGKPYRQSGGVMKYSEELGYDIPIDWSIIKLWERFEFKRGIEIGAQQYLYEPAYDRVLFWRVGDINSSCTTYAHIALFQDLFLSLRDVCVSFDGSIGKVDFGLAGGYSSGIRKIYDKQQEIDSSMIYLIFKSEYIQSIIYKYATGSNILHASNSIKNMYLPYNQRVFVDFQNIVIPIFDKMIQLKQENQKLAELRDWLLPILMNRQAKIE